MRAILVTILIASSTAAFADACGEFRSKRLTATAVGEAFNRAVSENSDTASEIGTAFDKAVDALWSAERAATAVILKQGGAWSEIIDLLMTSTGHVRSAREIILLSLPEGIRRMSCGVPLLLSGTSLKTCTTKQSCSPASRSHETRLLW